MERDLLMARNALGSFTPECRDRLQAVIDSPNENTWDDAYSIILNSGEWTTLWQAVCAVDPTFPKRGKQTDVKGRVIQGWSRVPDRPTLRQAIAYATH